MTGKLSIIVFSGTVDKLLPVGVLTTAAAASGYEVNLFFTFWGLNAIRKDMIKAPPRISKDFEDMGPMMMKMMTEKKVPSWYEMVLQAREIGNVKIYACSQTMDIMNLKKEDLIDTVDNVVGAVTFLEMAQGGITLFI
ncbi:MAG: DsrE/DsrF/DrsH-like family protein [Thermoprotei archaeon]|jgi:peroxiredoxin family protein